MPLGLDEAKSLAIRLNPQVAQDREAVEKAKGGEEIAFSGYLPTILGSYSYQAFSSNTGYAGIHDRFPVLPVRGFGPGTQAFNVTEAQLRWNVYQFGRQVAKHNQSVLKIEIAELQYRRSLQAAEYDVSQAYFQLLETQATLVAANQSMIRAEAILKDARDLLERGVITPEELLQAEVENASVRQLQIKAKSAAEVSVAGLNRSIGLDINAPTRVIERLEEPRVESSLEACLEIAAKGRPEIAVVRKGIAIADAEIRIARSEFLPTLSIQSSLSNVTGTAVQNANVLGGGAFATLELYTGGKRKGQIHTATAEARAAMALAKSICDGVAYETNVAYRAIEDARERIVQARTALAQARENLRLIGNRLKTGDAIPTELIEAQTLMTRTQQSYNSAYYDYQSGIARLEFAIASPIARRDGAGIAPDAVKEATPEPSPPSNGSPFGPDSGGGNPDRPPQRPSILPPGLLDPLPLPLEDAGGLDASRPGRPVLSPSLDRITSPSEINPPGLARPPGARP
ncbi:TolC family protein [Tundrisphaera lichenicola]|uniref:TolC family protein n=1 Tax=Tundrisphaera lichenicola TaxID=2029860 RepID=UPI003EBA85D3